MLKDATIPTLPLSMKNVNRRVLVDPTIDRSLQGHRSPISSVAFHPSPSLLATRKNSNIEQIASSSIDGELTLWNFSSEKEVRAYRYVGHTGPIHHVTYSPSGSLLASCSSDKTTRLWVPKVNGESIVLKGHTAPVRCVDFSPTSHVGCKNDMEDVSFLATCSDDKTVKVWNLPDKSFRCSFTGHTNWVRSCKFSPDSANILASGGDDGTIRIWDVTHGKNVVTYSVKADNAQETREINFHPSGTMVAAYGNDGIVRLYDLRSDEVIQTFSCRSKRRGHSSSYNRGNSGGGLAFHPSGQYLLVGNDEASKRGDNCFKIWDIRQNNSKLSINHGEKRSNRNATGTHSWSCCCAFSHDGAKFATGGMDKVVLVWNSNIEEISTAPHEFNNVGKTKRCEWPFTESKSKGIKPPIEYIAEHVAKVEADVTTDRNHTNEVKSFSNGDAVSEDIHLPETLAGTLEHIVGQIDLLTRTLALIEKRLSIQEENMTTLKLKNRNHENCNS